MERKVEAYAGGKYTLQRLWETLVSMGIDPNERWRQCGQFIPAPEDKRARLELFLTESLFTGLYTSEQDIALRCWPQAVGYAEALAAMGHEPGSYLRDLIGELRNRVEKHFIRDCRCS